MEFSCFITSLVLYHWRRVHSTSYWYKVQFVSLVLAIILFLNISITSFSTLSFFNVIQISKFVFLFSEVIYIISRSNTAHTRTHALTHSRTHIRFRYQNKVYIVVERFLSKRGVIKRFHLIFARDIVLYIECEEIDYL